MVGRRDDGRARLVGQAPERRAPQVAGRLLEGRAGSARARAAGRFRIDAQEMERQTRGAGEVLDVGGIAIGFFATQTVVDMGDHELEAARLRRPPQELEQDARVPPARNGDEHPAAREAEGIERPRERPLEGRCRAIGAGGVVSGASHRLQHSRRAAARFARRRRDGGSTDRAIRYSRHAMSRMTDAAPAVDPDLELPADVGRWIEFWAARQPDALAWVDDERRCSWREAADRVARLADWLRRAGVEPGARVALWLGNRTAVLEAIFAAARVGAIALPINARLTPLEVAFQLADATPRVLLVERAFRERADQALAAVANSPPPRCLEVGRGEPAGRPSAGHGAAADADADAETCAYERALAASDPAASPSAAAPFDPDAAMILMYTSGTTGQPKGALLPHRKTLANCRNARAGFGTTARDRVLVVTPLFHSLGLQILALPALYCGAAIFIQEGFDPARAWRAVEQEGITYLGAVPTAHQRLLDALGPQAPTSLRFVFTAGAAAPAALLHAYHRRGVAMLQGYGQTETSMLTCQRAEDALAKAGSVGRPLPLAELRLVEPATLDGPVAGWRDVEAGAVGEIVVRGPITMLGYWKRPEATRETLRGEWVRTGDLATRDGDFDVTLVGRAREMYISGGENVYPAEVEAVLESHPAIEEAAVVAIADATWGEVGRAHLVPRAGAALDLEALSEWLAPRLARFKHPRSFVVETSLPRTASGKVQKHRLADPAPIAPR